MQSEMCEDKAFLFVAVHLGPYRSIQPLEDELGPDGVLYLVDGPARDERVRKGLPYLDLQLVEKEWGSLRCFMQDRAFKAIIRSSSEDVRERDVESLVAAEAQHTGTSVFVVEDYPGTYWVQPTDRLDGLFVEGDTMIGHHHARGVCPDIIHNTGNPRYNALIGVGKAGHRARVRNSLGLRDESVMLWAGQPDGDNSYWALERLLRRFRRSDEATLVFRAHPRDEAYQSGQYEGLLARFPMRVIDASDYSNAIDLYCASDLVMTQFSSAGIEASFLGVPALFVLFDDLGKQWLRSFKGYDLPPWCQDYCTFLIETEDDANDILEQALFDMVARDEVCTRFQHRFGSKTDCVQEICKLVRDVVGN